MEMTDWVALGARVAVVTGGGSGIGAGIATVLAKAGALVVIADRNEAGARREAAALMEAGHQADWIVVDVADEASIVNACAVVAALAQLCERARLHAVFLVRPPDDGVQTDQRTSTIARLRQR
jgi:NAD(P)-dependent dehydrogenase (short-subunit alcohol dehydrogenase family)